MYIVYQHEMTVLDERQLYWVSASYRTASQSDGQLLNSAQQINLIWLKLALSLPVISWLVRYGSRRLTFHILE